MSSSDLQALKGLHVSAFIQYFDTDRTTVLHEKKAAGPVHHVDEEVGVVIAVNGDSAQLFKVPPLLQSFQQQLDGSYAVHWGVYRQQETRQDGQHEWWDWQPLSL